MADAAREQRQAALAAKKKRLEELKARRNQRAASGITAQDTAKAALAASSNLDDYIDGLLKVPGPSSTSVPIPTSGTVTSTVSPTEPAPLMLPLRPVVCSKPAIKKIVH